MAAGASLLLAAAPARAAITYVGRVASTTVTAASTSTVLTAGRTVTAGDAIVVAVLLSSTSTTAAKVVDSAGNTYALDRDLNDGSAGDRVVVFSATNAKALPSGGTITITYPSSAECNASVDEFTGIGATDSKIFSLTLMATGPVQTVEGPREVPLASAPAKPPAAVPFALAPGVNRLGFKGQWGVDFDLFIVAERPQQATVTGWKHFWHPTPEADEYKQTTGRKFEEAQYIVRLRGTGPFDVVIVPYRRGGRPPDLVLTQNPDGVLSLLRNGKTTTLAD